MPTYAYRCPSCGHAFDRFHKMSETAPQPCAECGTPAQRVITGGAGLVFKGSGFYITDYKKGAGKKDDAAGGTSEKGKSDSGKSDGSKASSGGDSPSAKKTAGDGT